MSDKFESFMKKNVPEEAGTLKTLKIPPKKNWLVGVAASGLLAASLAVVVVNQQMKYDALIQAEEALDVSFDDEFPEEYSDVDTLIEDL